MVPLSDHLLRITGIDSGWTGFQLDCTHGDDIRFHHYPVVEGGPRIQRAECWLQTWWSELGAELIVIPDDPDGCLSFPLPVKPSDDWDFDGGTLVRDQ